jgi:hypothetical protein
MTVLMMVYVICWINRAKVPVLFSLKTNLTVSLEFLSSTYFKRMSNPVRHLRVVPLALWGLRCCRAGLIGHNAYVCPHMWGQWLQGQSSRDIEWLCSAYFLLLLDDSYLELGSQIWVWSFGSVVRNSGSHYLQKLRTICRIFIDKYVRLCATQKTHVWIYDSKSAFKMSRRHKPQNAMWKLCTFFKVFKK